MLMVSCSPVSPLLLVTKLSTWRTVLYFSLQQHSQQETPNQHCQLPTRKSFYPNNIIIMKLNFLLFSVTLGMCGASSPVRLSDSNKCPSGYTLAPTKDFLNGDLNQSAGGKDIFLCLALSGALPLYGLKLQQSRSCGSGWALTPHPGSLNGDLNQSAGGKDIFLCYSTNPGQGGSKKIIDITLTRYKPLDLHSPLRPDGLNGDLNQSAGGKDIFLQLTRDEPPRYPLILARSTHCPRGYNLVQAASEGLNGDLNQSAGGRDIFLCEALDAVPVYRLKLQQSRICGNGWALTPPSGDLNGDLNQSAGGKDIFLCYTTHPGLGREARKIKKIYLTEDRPAENLWMPWRKDGLNGDLNQSAGGKDIFLEIFRDEGSTKNWLPTVSSFHEGWTKYDFSGYPEPGYEPVEIIGTAVAPCWHAQQLVTFADEDYLYTFYTMSQSRHGKAYLLRVPLTNPDIDALPAVDTKGTVIWYQETTGFNHPGDLVISGRIILTANQNWDPTSFGQKIGCGLIGGCNCRASLASRRQALTIWNFNGSLQYPARATIDKATFNRILPDGDKMDNSDADQLWGGNVDGHLIINFESKWLHWKGSNIGNVNSWERISTNYPTTCPEETTGSNNLFTTINGKSYLATFAVDNPCYTLRPASYDASSRKLIISCAGMISRCTRGGQLVHSSSKGGEKAFQTITQGPTGQVFMTSLNLYGTKTQVVASSVPSLLYIQIESRGLRFGNKASIVVDGESAIAPGGRGLNVVVINDDGVVISRRTFDTFRDTSQSESFARFIAGLPDGRWVLIAVKDEASRNLTKNAKNAIKRLGSTKIDSLGYRQSWCIIGRTGAMSGTVVEEYNPSGAAKCVDRIYP